MTPWISVESLHILGPSQSIPAGGECNKARLITRREFNAGLHADREFWWSQQALEIKHAAATEKYRKLF